jgi:hypothetical protein
VVLGLVLHCEHSAGVQVRSLVLLLALAGCWDDYCWLPTAPIPHEDVRLCAPARYMDECLKHLGHKFEYVRCEP